ncbi:MAG: 4Fe-4S cluster-binding domain-containing protein, partial [Carnobacterium inhibens]
IDGRFELAKRDLTLSFRGSSNQKIIDVQQSLARNSLVLWKEKR